ncbi:MAG TPA: alpha/beta hydrolase [Anaerolineae bacterium]|nr:alpha/beta hydrolase [Anaerolineae bacterium]
MDIPAIGETKELDELARAHAPGAFSDLTAGATHYRVTGPRDGRSVVLIHGIAGPMGIWDPLIQSLSYEHLSILQYDLYGRGYSDRPRLRYDVPLFLRQLEELLAAASMTTPIVLVGWSLGAIIAASYAAERPGMVDRLVLIAPAGIQVSLPTVSRVGILPILGDVFMSLFGRRLVLRSVARGLHIKSLQGDLRLLLQGQMLYKGYLRAFLATLRSVGTMDASQTYLRAGLACPSVLMISGSHDPSIPGSVQLRMQHLIPSLVQCSIADAGHFPHFERPQEVSSQLHKFLQ